MTKETIKDNELLIEALKEAQAILWGIYMSGNDMPANAKSVAVQWAIKHSAALKIVREG